MFDVNQFIKDHPEPLWDKDPDSLREHNAQTRLWRLYIKQAALEHYQIRNNPKADRCWDLAWNYGHANGFYDVVSYLDDLVSLIK